MRAKRLYHSMRLLLCRSSASRARYLKKHSVLGTIGDNCRWGPWLLPLYPELIKLHNNVMVHKTAKLVPHDMVNYFLSRCRPGVDFGAKERIGCIELMDNVHISMNVIVMPNVRIGQNCFITAGSVVSADIPENSVANGIPAKPIGKFDMFLAMRKMQASQNAVFKNQELPEAVAHAEWEKFNKRHENAETSGK